MKFVKWIAILLMVLLSGFFLISSEKGADKHKEKSKIMFKVHCDHHEDWDFDFLDDLKINLKGLDEKIERIVHESLKDLEVNIDLKGLEDRLESLHSLDCLKDLKIKVEDLAEIECLKVLENLEFFFEDFEWDFNWDWDCRDQVKKKSRSSSKKKEDI
jgi:hypothetical protein